MNEHDWCVNKRDIRNCRDLHQLHYARKSRGDARRDRDRAMFAVRFERRKALAKAG